MQMLSFKQEVIVYLIPIMIITVTWDLILINYITTNESQKNIDKLSKNNKYY